MVYLQAFPIEIDALNRPVETWCARFQVSAHEVTELNYADEMPHSNGPVARSYRHFVVRARWYHKLDWCMDFSH
jgi:hypothetical protein